MRFIPNHLNHIALFLLTGVIAAFGQTRPPLPTATVPVLMLSDLHFDPFRDPAKVAKLAAAPLADWTKILTAPAFDDRAAAYASLEAACRAKGEDSDFDLLSSSLRAEKAAVPKPEFITISGDLLVHQFDCRYHAIIQGGDGYAAFAEKTASFVIRSVEQEFPGTPVYVALGNNDSSCGDYRMDPRDRFFQGTGDAVMAGILPTTGQAPARADYETGGYYSALLPGMKKPTRLLMIDDIYLSKNHSGCSGKPDSAGATAMMSWLTAQIDAARQRNERLWVMGHIPPGVNVYATLRKGNVCTGAGAEQFLSPLGQDSLGDIIAMNGDEIDLALFGHTHMDEMKLLAPEGSTKGGVPMKGVASISPVDGNRPSFTVARIDPANSKMQDYAVYVAPDANGGTGQWTREYGFDATYGQTVYSAAAVRAIVNGFHADPNAATPASAAYERFFDARFPISPLVLGWPQYACGMDHLTDAAFKACACPAAH